MSCLHLCALPQPHNTLNRFQLWLRTLPLFQTLTPCIYVRNVFHSFFSRPQRCVHGLVRHPRAKLHHRHIRRGQIWLKRSDTRREKRTKNNTWNANEPRDEWSGSGIGTYRLFYHASWTTRTKRGSVAEEGIRKITTIYFTVIDSAQKAVEQKSNSWKHCSGNVGSQ